MVKIFGAESIASLAAAVSFDAVGSHGSTAWLMETRLASAELFAPIPRDAHLPTGDISTVLPRRLAADEYRRPAPGSGSAAGPLPLCHCGRLCLKLSSLQRRIRFHGIPRQPKKTARTLRMMMTGIRTRRLTALPPPVPSLAEDRDARDMVGHSRAMLAEGFPTAQGKILERACSGWIWRCGLMLGTGTPRQMASPPDGQADKGNVERSGCRKCDAGGDAGRLSALVNGPMQKCC